MIQRPLKTYNGGKAGNGTYQNIINHIPKCSRFIDAMVGNAGIVSNLSLPAITVLNDIDPAIIARFNYKKSESVIIESLCVMDLIDKYDCNAGTTFFYFDPPYLKSSRKSQADLYRYEWTLQNHQAFLSRVLTVKSNCMISHYPCPLYDEALKNWHQFSFYSTTHKGQALERIYMNYPPPSLLQDNRYIGKDYIDRQRIKRKAKRFIHKLAALPHTERQSILHEVYNRFPQQPGLASGPPRYYCL